MTEKDREQFGDGPNQYGQAAGQLRNAARQISETASAGAEAASGARAAAESGKAVAGVTAGTAAAGPAGALISAGWSVRHFLFRVLVCLCLLLLLFVILIVSIPSIVLDGVFGLNGIKPEEGQTIQSSYTEMADAVSEAVDTAYDRSLRRVEHIIEAGGYAYDLSMEALENHAQASAGYDVSYILAAYSASMQQQGTSREDMTGKLNRYLDQMFPVTYEVLTKEEPVPVRYMTYQPVTVTVVVEKIPAAIVNGVTRYNYVLGERSMYVPDRPESSSSEVKVTRYHPETVMLPIYADGRVIGTRNKIYYVPDGAEVLAPGTKVIQYAACTIHPFDTAVIIKAFAIDPDAEYPQFRVTYETAIQNMTAALKRTVYGSVSSGSGVPLTDAELIEFVNRQECSAVRKHILSTGLALVGKVPYFWGGKSAAGWNDEWNTPKLVTAAGSITSGTIRPFGLDCSGFTDWTYRTALGVSLQQYGGQWDSTSPISAEELLPGDLGFLGDGMGDWTHVLMFAGFSESGDRMWVHSSGGEGVTLNTPGYESVLFLRRPKDVDFDAPPAEPPYGEPLYSLEVEVTHYCACPKCCGAGANGITASGKPVSQGMAAMSSRYPFGTLIRINGVMYTVEDRGGAGIENNPSRVDIFVPDHQEALRLGRFTATAQIYRIGR